MANGTMELSKVIVRFTTLYHNIMSDKICVTVPESWCSGYIFGGNIIFK